MPWWTSLITAGAVALGTWIGHLLTRARNTDERVETQRKELRSAYVKWFIATDAWIRGVHMLGASAVGKAIARPDQRIDVLFQSMVEAATLLQLLEPLGEHLKRVEKISKYDLANQLAHEQGANLMSEMVELQVELRAFQRDVQDHLNK